jgi:hypothetical protein
LFNDAVDKKVKLFLCLINYELWHEDLCGSGGIAPIILDLDTRWRWLVSFSSQPLYSMGKRPLYPWIGAWVGPRTVLDEDKNLSLPGIETRPSSPSLYRRLTALSIATLYNVEWRTEENHEKVCQERLCLGRYSNRVHHEFESGTNSKL